MALWNTADRVERQLIAHVTARCHNFAALFAIGAALALLLVWLIPLPLVLPVLSIMSFVIASIAALLAHSFEIDRRRSGMTFWDAAAVFALIWIGAGALGGSKHIIKLFDQVAMVP
jgi:hypothetical protein